jgi:hypothetical protein
MRILKIYQKPFSVQKIAQAITSIVTYILDFFIFMEGEGVLSGQNRLRGSHTKLRAKIAVISFSEKQGISRCFISKKKRKMVYIPFCH